MDLIYILSFVIVILATIYYYLTWNYDFWKKQGIPYNEEIVPGFGNMKSVFFLKQSFSSMCEKLYKDNKTRSMFGFFQFTTPALLIRDPELVKNVLLTNFASFADNHIEVSSSKQDTVFAINPFFSKNDTWKENRAPLTNAFSGKKLKLMLPLVQDIASKLEAFLKRKSDFHRGKLQLELKDLANMFTGEIAAAGIGLQSHNFQDETEATKDLWMYKKFIEKFFSEPFFTGGYKQIIYHFLPRIAKICNLSLVPDYVFNFFQKAVKNNLIYRQRENFKGNDFLQIIVDYYQTNGKNNVDNDAIISHMVTFSIEIYESSAITLSWLLFQLAIYPEIQERVREEIQILLEKNNGKLDYDDLNKMTYFDQVLNESMRINHILGTLSKVCTKEIQLIGSDGLSCTMKPGNTAVISTYGLQMDPKYWPDPEKFDPERFNEEQKSGRPKFTFIPFGEGPRICVGMRMAVMMIKLAAAAILKNYSLSVSPKTSLPLKKSETSFMTAYDEGLWVCLKPLNDSSYKNGK